MAFKLFFFFLVFFLVFFSLSLTFIAYEGIRSLLWWMYLMSTIMYYVLEGESILK